MLKSKLSKNGMINLPVKIRNTLGIRVGDEIGFIELDGEFKIVPIYKMSDLTDSKHLEATKELIEKMRKERENER